jgi:chromosome segregation ATPase
VAKPKSQEPQSPTEWVDAQLREAKARLHKVEGELDQALKHMWALDADVRKTLEALTTATTMTGVVQAVREEVRQLQAQFATVQDRQSAMTTRVQELGRHKTQDSKHDGPELGSLLKQLEGFGRSIEQFDTRMRALEEIARHVEEEVGANRLVNQGLERSMEEATNRSARAHEASLRLDQDMSRFTGDVEKLEKTDEALVDRMRVLLEQLRRTSERLDKLEGLASFPDEARELLQRAAFERDQLTQRLSQIEHVATEVSERLQEFLQSIARVDQRTQTQAGELLGLAEQLQEMSEQTRSSTKRVFQILLRQRRRQAETLAQEVKELTQGELHSGD